MNNYVLFASRLMTAGEVRVLCTDLKKQKYILEHFDKKAKEKQQVPSHLLLNH